MATVEYLHICDYAFVDQAGKPCIVGIYDGINAGSFPATHPQLFLGIQFRGTPHEMIPLVIEIGRPNGDVLWRSPEMTPVAGQEGGAFVAMNIVGVQFPEPARYTVKVLSGGRVLVTQSLRLSLVQQGGGAAPSPRLH
jgi:hypothetical protein